MPMRSARRTTIIVLRTAIVLLALCCLAVGALIYLEQKARPVLTPEADALFVAGVSAMGVPLEGMTMDEARTALRAEEQSILKEVNFQMDTGTESISLTAADFDVRFDTEEVLAKLMELGNTGTREEQNAAREQLLAAPVDGVVTYMLDAEPLRPRFEALKAQADTEPVDATVEMDLTVEGWFRFTQGQPGRSLDVDTLLMTLNNRAERRSFGFVELPFTYTEPVISVEQLQATLVRRGRAETSFAKSPYNRADRVFNVKKAAGLVNGFVLKPGEEFSTNDTLGPRTYELGWKPAPAYVQGTTEDQAGGGVCQVSSTLYAAVVKSDLEIVYRRNHSSTVGYIPYGLDATINTGTIDFQFKNNTASDIYIFAYTIDAEDGEVPEGMDNQTVHVEIYGEPLPPEYDEIRLEAEKIETLKPSGEKEIVVDTTVAADYYKEDVERRNGSVYQSYKIYYKDGEEVKREELAKSTYKAYNGKVTVGTGYYARQVPEIPVLD